MPWLSRNSFTPTDKLHADDLNNLANDDRTWGGNVNGGGYTLSNVNIVELNPLAGGQVSSVFARIGDVVAMAGDYTAAQVGAVPTARQIITGPTSGLSGGGPLSTDLTLTAAVKSVFSRTGDVLLTGPDITAAGGVLNTRQIKTLAGSGLSGGGALSADLSLSVLPDTTNQQIQVMSQGNPIGAPRHAINFISGTGALITVSEISASNRIDVTVASTGTGGGMVDPTQVVGDLIVRGLTAPATRMPVGTDGQVLTADHLQALGVKWATPANVGQVTSVFTRTGAVTAVVGDYSAAQITNAVDQTGNYVNPPWITSLPWSKISNPPLFMLDPTVAKGDLIVHGATTTRLPAGADGSVLTADSTLAAGVKWGAVPIISFNTRGGAVLPLAGDYTVAQVTGAVPTTLTINTGTGLQGGGNLSSNRTFAVVPDTTNQQIQVLLAGAVVGTRHAINFVNGANVSLSISDNVGSNQIDLTVSSTGGGGGMVDPTTGIGDIIVRGATAVQRLGVGLNGQVLTCDNTQALGIRWAVPTGGGGSGSQTPWTGNVDAANFNLNNVGGIGVNVASNKTVARVYAFVNTTEDGFRAVTSNAAGMAAASFINDLGDSISIRSYGSGFVGGLPGLATLEASKPLALLANAAEVMRLTSGRVLIGTTTDDAVNMLQVNGKVKSKVGGFVFPDSTIQTTAYTSASSPVTSVFTRTGAVVQVVGDYSAAQVTNAVDSSSTYSNPSWISSLAWSKITGAPALLVDPTTGKGDIIARGATGPATRLAASATNGWVLTADSAQPLGVKWAATPAQTPWTSNIDGGGFTLFNVGKLGVGVTVPYSMLHVRAGASSVSSAVNTDTVAFFDHSSNAYLEVVAGAGKQAGVILGANAQTNATQLMDVWDGTNHNLALNAGFAGSYITFSTVAAERMRITATGMVGIGNNASVNPGGIATDIKLILGNASVVNGPYSALCLVGNTSNTIDQVGSISFANYNLAAADKRLAAINCQTDAALNSGAMIFYAANAGTLTERMRITAAGNVAIGITGTGNKFHVQGGRSVFVGGGDPYSLAVSYSDFSVSGFHIGATSAGDLVFNTWGGTERMRVMNGGNVGVGTTGPATTLHVYGSSTAPGGELGSLLVTGGGNQYRVAIGYNSGTGYGWIQSVQNGVAPTALILNANGGNIGIGTTSPQAQLTLNSAVATDTPGSGHRLQFTWTDVPIFGWRIGSGNDGFVLDGSGPTGWAAIIGIRRSTYNVGIGTVSPTNRLTVLPLNGVNPSTTAGCQIACGEYTDNPGYRLRVGFALLGGDWHGVVQSVANSTGYRLALNPDGGNVGVGKIAPAYPLDVNGYVNTSSVYLVQGLPCPRITAYLNQGGARALNTTYANSTGAPIFVAVHVMLNASCYMHLRTDLNNPPTNVIFATTNTYSNSAGGSVSGWVMSGQYYYVFCNGGSIVTWYEWT